MSSATTKNSQTGDRHTGCSFRKFFLHNVKEVEVDADTDSLERTEFGDDGGDGGDGKGESMSLILR